MSPPVEIDLAIARKVEGHNCSLPIEDELLTLYLNSGLFVTLRRKIRRLFLVSPSHPYSRQHYKSTTQIRLEEAKQLSEYYNMIHPFSMGRFYMETIMIFIYLSLFILLPVQAGLQRTPYSIKIVRVVLDCVALLDVVFDVLPLFPGYFMHELNSDLAYYSRVVYVFRLVRIPTCLRYIRAVFAIYAKSPFLVHGLVAAVLFLPTNIALYLLTAICWISAFNYLLLAHHYDIQTDSEYDYLTLSQISETILRSFFVTTRTLLLIRTMEEDLMYFIGCFMQIICLIVGGIITIMMFVEVTKIYTQNSSAAAHFNNTMIELEAYMNYKELPPRTRARILEYVHFKYHGNIITSEIIQENASSIIKTDILLSESKALLVQVDFFRDLPDYILLELIMKLKDIVYLSGEVITQVGEPSNCMFFIKMGTVAIYAQRGNELCHLDDGQCFGELALMVTNEMRTFTAVSVDSSNILRLTRKEFIEAMRPFPEHYQHSKAIGLKKVVHLQRHFM